MKCFLCKGEAEVEAMSKRGMLYPLCRECIKAVNRRRELSPIFVPLRDL